MTALAAGVDGCRGGWVIACAPFDGGEPVLSVTPRFSEVIRLIEGGVVTSAAVDMPIGLTETGDRSCDREARRLLGARRSSVFPAPARSVLSAASYAEACARSRNVCGRALSRQSWNLVPKIAELDACMTPALQIAVGEATPEGSFAEAGGRPCQWPKRTAVGRAEREVLLDRIVPGWRSGPLRLGGAAADDVLDALALLWTAQRRGRGDAEWVGDDSLDSRGLRMQIWR